MTGRRVLLLGDMHGNWRAVRDAIGLAVRLKADRIVSVGDFGIWPGSDGNRFLDAVDTALTDSRLEPLLVCPGNHEDWNRTEAAPVDDDGMQVIRSRIRAIPRGHTWDQHGRVWQALGGAPSIDGPGGIWPQSRGPVIARDGDEAGEVLFDLGSWWPAERIAEDDVTRSIAATETVIGSGRRVEVFVSHDAPSWIDLGYDHKWPLGADQRALLTRAINHARPDVTVCGHHHRHVVMPAPWGGVGIVLSADVNPDEPQWAVLETPHDPAEPVKVLRRKNWRFADALPYQQGTRPRTGRLEPIPTRQETPADRPEHPQARLTDAERANPGEDDE